MRLKRLELAGFKSFADKTVLEFVQGITAVVGPNGSGKSNISDSIRWVLGEQSAKSLRGGKMEDIIFSGSDSRRAVNFGEVTLYLDNEDHALPLDYSEVSVTRRIHRNGDSEYFINKQNCRLKDITELFMDTGLGKEAYSIIGQGRIEEVLSTKSEERRGIFEEASGIVKYKSRKKEAQKKLEDTEKNIVRIHDLISELESQVEPLKEQSEKALIYKQLKEELKQFEISLYVVEIERLHSSWKEAGELLNQLRDQQLSLSTIVNQHDAKLEQERLEIRRLEEVLEQLQQSLLEISENFDKASSHVEVLKERKKNEQRNQGQLHVSMEQQEKRYEEKGVELTQYKTKYEEIGRTIEQVRAELMAEEQRLSLISGEKSDDYVDALKADMMELKNRSAHVTNESKFIEQQIETIERRLEKLKLDRDRLIEQIYKLGEHKSGLQSELDGFGQQIEDARKQFISLSHQLNETQSLHEQLLVTVRKWEQKKDALSSRRDTLQELHNEFDGFAQGVKEILRLRDQGNGLKGIRGAIAELVKVPEHLETAMETALGAALQHIVMDNESRAREAIAYLKQRHLGRATFLPLNVIQARSITEPEATKMKAIDGFVGIAVELVQFDGVYRDIIHNLLGNVVIARHMEQANKIAAAGKYRYRVVTLDGDVVNAGGSMTGGSVHKRNNALLGRQRQIDQLMVEIAETDTQLEQLYAQEQQLRGSIAEMNTKIESLRSVGEQKRLEEQDIRAKQHHADSEIANLRSQITSIDQDELELKQEIQLNEQKLQQLANDVKKLQDEEALLDQSIAVSEEKRKLSETALEELRTHLTDAKVKHAALSQEKQSLEEQMQRFVTELEHTKLELDENRRLQQEGEQELATIEEQLLTQTELVNEWQLKKQQCTEDIEFKRADRARWLAKIEQEESHIKEQRSQLKQIEDKLHQTEVKSNRLDVELDNMLRKLSEDYEMSFEWAKERFAPPENVPETQSRVQSLKRQISQLGEFNLGAIEEYERVSERYNFLSEQKNDLLEAKATLYEVIKEMNVEMSKRFEVTFAAIRSHFQDVFVQLFGGGRADLVLTDPNNLLDTGIDIVAQPPGKKLQNLQLLSGGERALTAIALLFAILRVKPVPFCVLDEVEAALDEANVSRFAQYLRAFSEETQFIVVTHRKGTMEEADVLYGVTMEEGGVSKLVSVKLDDTEAATA